MIRKLFSLLALVLLLGGFGYSAWRVFTIQRKQDGSSGRIVIRIGHWMQQTGMRESFDEAAADYQKLHPNVVVEQITVPIRAWPAWVRTQLIGGTAPDITGINGSDEENLGRHYISLNQAIDAPNPYNAGTPLEGAPWRDTFLDGLSSMFNLTPTTGELAAVYLQLNTIRLFYNKTLLKEITGSSEAPANFAALQALGRQIEDYNRRTGKNLVPIASCEPYAPYLLGEVLPSQTQKLTRELSPLRTFTIAPVEIGRLLLDGTLSYDTPEVRSSLSLLSDVSKLLTPGFTSLQRDDALFAFLQQNAVMICAGSWDYAVFVSEGDFEVGISPIPLPATDDPNYGHNVIGPSSEAGGMPEAQLGITRYSKHPEVALDFLRFLTSYRTAEKFSERTLRLSAIVSVPPPSRALDLAPRLTGEVNGFGINLPASFGGGNSSNVFQRNRHLMLGQRGDVDAFAKVLATEMPAALRRDIAQQMARTARAVQRLDAHIGLLLSAPDDTHTEQKKSRLLESQQLRQFDQAIYSPSSGAPP